MDVVYVNDSVVDDTDQILLREGLLLRAVVCPFLFHLQTDTFDHTSQEFSGVDVFLDLLVADVEKNIDAFDSDHRILFFEVGPGDVDVYPLDVAEFESEGESEFVDEGGFEGYVFNGDFSVEQSDIEAVFESVDVLA
jgi:hypothetical protein